MDKFKKIVKKIAKRLLIIFLLVQLQFYARIFLFSVITNNNYKAAFKDSSNRLEIKVSGIPFIYKRYEYIGHHVNAARWDPFKLGAYNIYWFFQMYDIRLTNYEGIPDSIRSFANIKGIS